MGGGSYVYCFGKNPFHVVTSIATDNHFVIEKSGNIVEVDPETVCQYTGLTDKNGEKIWENDIVKCGEKLVVTWKEKLASFCLSKKGWLYQHFFGEAVNAKDVEVCGNIFDNP